MKMVIQKVEEEQSNQRVKNLWINISFIVVVCQV